MDQANEPLAHRLRNAAIARTTTEAERVDDFVLDKDGVLDLRTIERDAFGTSVADPAKALATIRGRLGDAHEVSDLYDESEPEPPRWRLVTRSRATPATAVLPSPEAPEVRPDPVVAPRPTLNRLSKVPLTSERAAPAPATDVGDDATVADTGVYEARTAPIDDGIDIDLRDTDPRDIDPRDEDRPTANCPRCMGLGHRDLFDRFSQVEFYSCDNCMHMWQQDRA